MATHGACIAWRDGSRSTSRLAAISNSGEIAKRTRPRSSEPKRYAITAPSYRRIRFGPNRSPAALPMRKLVADGDRHQCTRPPRHPAADPRLHAAVPRLDGGAAARVGARPGADPAHQVADGLVRGRGRGGGGVR